MKPLEAYDISANRGYLCRFDADQVALTGPLAEARAVALASPIFCPQAGFARS